MLYDAEHGLTKNNIKEILKLMRVIRLFLTTFTLFYVLSAAVALAEDASIVRATEVNGVVLKNGSQIKEGDIIQRDDRMETKENSSAVFTWSNGSIVEVYPETSIVLKGIIFDGEKKIEKTILAMERGRIFAKAQVPEHLFSQFSVAIENVTVITQGAEFALKYDKAEKKFTVWSLIGRMIIPLGVNVARVEEGYQIILKTDGSIETPQPIAEKTKEALMKTSKRLGGSLLIEEETAAVGGPLKIKIGGVKSRRGDAPYTVKFKAVVSGGSGKIKYIRWSFGDGEGAEGKEAQHTFTQGVYVVVVTVEDENGQKATSQINISAEEACAC
ncbi:MAG: PKD domain-containing protein [Nitrospirae bacterium]|nr:PKD domain-containing protein [Nitrospirota bacterium]